MGFDLPDQPHVYLSILQSPGYAMAVYLKTSVNPLTLAHALRREVQSVDPDLPVFGEESMEDVVAASLAQRRFAMQLLIAFGGVALLLAGVGIYGVMAYSVSQRTREIGIRLALGAKTGDIIRWVMTQAMMLTLAGVGIGLVAAVAPDAAANGFPVWRSGNRSDDLRRAVCFACAGGARRLLCSGAPRDASRSDDRAQIRMISGGQFAVR